LGSTGSIGTQALEVIQALNGPEEKFEVVALAAGRNFERLIAQIRRFQPRFVSLDLEEDLRKVQEELGSSGKRIEWTSGPVGLGRLVARSGAHLVINGLVGAVGLQPTLCALEAGIDVALANKESLVIGGHLVKGALKQGGAQLLPVDSEHSSLFQLLKGRSTEEIARLVLTASGGALRDWPLLKLGEAHPSDVLRHPNWQMGPRITVDSATLVNKGFETIEAHWLFDLPYERIGVVLHPQSFVHGLVELRDGTFLAHLGAPDMHLPIQYALTYPERYESDWPKLELSGLTLNFTPLDAERYLAFFTVIEAGRLAGTYPAAINAADEVLVARFLRSEIAFTDIAKGLARVLESHSCQNPEPSLAELLAADAWAREFASRL
jgi:1-deoxy-D-xylulose-5-phosphate reductoisomerase